MDKRFFSALVAFIISLPVIAQKSTALEIIINKCTSCHKDGGDAPFSLTNYAEVKRKITTIEKVVQSGYMPPWKADNHYRSYSNDKSLSDEEKNRLLDWISNGAKKEKVNIAVNNNTRTAIEQAATKYHRTVTIKSDFKYSVKGDNTERFVLFKIPFENDQEVDISGIEFISNNKRVVHHVNYGIFSVDEGSVDIQAGSKFIVTDDPKANQAEYDHLTKSPVYYTGWIPGSSGEDYPKNFGWALPRRGVVIFTVHFSSIPVNEEFDFGVRLKVAEQPIERKIKIISFGSGGYGEKDITPKFALQPNQLNKFDLKMVTRDPQAVMYVWPHMHMLGKSFKSYVITPAKDTIPLVSIPQWDYRWQELYRMKQLTYIPRGSVLVMEGVYDNTSGNPLNPNNPPQLVLPTRNMESTKEMFTLLMIYVPYQPGDEKIKLD